MERLLAIKTLNQTGKSNEVRTKTDLERNKLAPSPLPLPSGRGYKVRGNFEIPYNKLDCHVATAPRNDPLFFVIASD